MVSTPGSCVRGSNCEALSVGERRQGGRSQNTKGQLGGREPQCDAGSFTEVDLEPGKITGNSMLVQCQSKSSTSTM